MRRIGYSTGAIAKGDFRRALQILNEAEIDVVELSALRLGELESLIAALPGIDLSAFDHVSFHAPSAIPADHERDVVLQLRSAADQGFPIVVHPDVIHDPSLWAPLGSNLCLENMDKRKHTGRFVSEMALHFDLFPAARFCLDLAHAHQIDPTMIECRFLLEHFGDRLAQVHISELDSQSRHRLMGAHAARAYQPLAHLIPDQIPIIIESLIDEDPAHELMPQLEWARESLCSDRAAA